VNRKWLVIGVVGFCAAANMGSTAACGSGGGGGPARSATHAGDGITQFGDGSDRNYANKGSTGKLKWGKTYNAHKVNPQDVQNCKWSLYKMDSLGRTTFIKKGGYATAKINVGEQVTQKVYLKSLDCGIWE
jgi:hypothetical protein